MAITESGHINLVGNTVSFTDDADTVTTRAYVTDYAGKGTNPSGVIVKEGSVYTLTNNILKNEVGGSFGTKLAAQNAHIHCLKKNEILPSDYADLS